MTQGGDSRYFADDLGGFLGKRGDFCMKKENHFDLDGAIRKVQDFPIPGILYYDITSVLTNPPAFSWCLDEMERLYRGSSITSIAAIEARGFLFAAPLAQRLALPLVLLRKEGKLPGKTLSADYTLEYGVAKIELHQEDVKPEDRFLIVDDLIGTGGTIEATISLIEQCGAKVEDIFGIIGLPFLGYEKKLASYRVKTLLNYEQE